MFGLVAGNSFFDIERVIPCGRLGVHSVGILLHRNPGSLPLSKGAELVRYLPRWGNRVSCRPVPSRELAALFFMQRCPFHQAPLAAAADQEEIHDFFRLAAGEGALSASGGVNITKNGRFENHRTIS